MRAGRPLLVLPYAGECDVPADARVLVAWNGSREATRAVHDAMPLLVKAKLVHVIAVNPTGGMAGHGDVPGADICLHLSRHGVNAVCEHQILRDLNVGQMRLLARPRKMPSIMPGFGLTVTGYDDGPDFSHS